MLTQECIKSVFTQYTEELREIKSYKALALIEEIRKILVSDQTDPAIHLSSQVNEINSVFSSPNSTDFANLNKGESVILQKKTMSYLLKPQSETIPSIRLIGFTAEKGNWIYMKMNLKKSWKKN